MIFIVKERRFSQSLVEGKGARASVLSHSSTIVFVNAGIHDAYSQGMSQEKTTLIELCVIFNCQAKGITSH